MDLQEDNNTQAHAHDLVDVTTATPTTTTNTTHIPQSSTRSGNAFSSSSTTTLLSPSSSSSPPPDLTLQCCCGRLDCAYLKHNNVALGDLESNLETAARLGQVSFLLYFIFNFFFLAILRHFTFLVHIVGLLYGCINFSLLSLYFFFLSFFFHYSFGKVGVLEFCSLLFIFYFHVLLGPSSRRRCWKEYN